MNYNRRLSAPNWGSLKRQKEKAQAELTRRDGERLARERAHHRAREKIISQQKVCLYS